jgi:hypothetical protein
MTVNECRKILGKLADEMTDAEIEAERDHMEALANVIFDQFTAEMKRDPERMKWLLYAHENGVSPDDFTIERVYNKDDSK